MKQHTVAQLRQKGFKVHISHIRRAVAHAHVVKLCQAQVVADSPLAMVPYELAPTGGITVVDLLGPNHPENQPCFHGEAHCYKKDTYNKRVGVQIALGRALKEAEGAGVQVPA